MSPERKRACLGAFAGAHGVKGETLVKYFTEAPENIAAYGPVETEDGARSFTLKFLRATKPGFAVVSAPELTGREDAQALKGVRLYVDRAVLPEPEEDAFYLDDLIGLAVVDETGAPAGRVAAVHNFGAGDLIELKNIPGRSGAVMIAFTKDAVPEVDIEAQKIVVARAALEDQETSSSSDEREADIVVTDESDA